jgi:hypothetical protein
MNICAVALSIASLIFSSHMLYSTCAGQGRTYSGACASRAEADEWANAIRNNVAALPKEASKYSCFYSLSLSLSLSLRSALVLVFKVRCFVPSL